MRRRILANVLVVPLVLAGCARDRIVPAAQQASAKLAALRQDLAKYQMQYDAIDKSFEANRGAIIVSRNVAAAQVRIYQDDLGVRSAGKPADLFATLQSQGKAYVTAAATTVPPMAAPAPPKLPLDQIDAVIKNLAPLGTPPSRISEAEFLLAFASDTNTALGRLTQGGGAATPDATTSPQTPVPKQ
jgi:hypothetical protein